APSRRSLYGPCADPPRCPAGGDCATVSAPESAQPSAQKRQALPVATALARRKIGRIRSSLIFQLYHAERRRAAISAQIFGHGGIGTGCDAQAVEQRRQPWLEILPVINRLAGDWPTYLFGTGRQDSSSALVEAQTGLLRPPFQIVQNAADF